MSILRRAGAALGRLVQSSSDPSAEAERVMLYAKDVSGSAELFARSSGGVISQLTPTTINLLPTSVTTGPATVPVQVGWTHYVNSVSPGSVVTLTLPAANLYQRGEIFAIVNTSLSGSAQYLVQPLPSNTADGLGLGVAGTYSSARNAAIWTSDGVNGWWVLGARAF